MFKKSEPETQQPEPQTTQAMRDPQQPRPQATIGATVRIKGDVTGDENLTVDGTVEGTITLRQHSLQVGKNGRLNADVHAKSIRVEGHVEGNLFAEEQVLVRQSGVVRGNIVSPRVTMEDGCSFKGSIDMEAKPSDRKTAAEPAGRSVASVAAVPAGTEKKMETAAAR